MLIQRLKIYDRSILTALEYMIQLKLNFDDAANLIIIYNELKIRRDYLKTPFYIQVPLYGGEITENIFPYYKFDDIDKQNDFEKSFNSYILASEEFKDISLITCEVSQKDFDNIPINVIASLSGIVTITAI